MAKINKHIEIVSSVEAGLSSMSDTSRRAVLAVLTKHYAGVRITTIRTLSDLQALVARRPDLVFLGMKFIPVDPMLGLNDPHKIWVSKYLDDHGIAYTGSGHLAHELELDKPKAKQRVLDTGLSTSPFYEVLQGATLVEQPVELRYPLFVKPTNRGGGLGVDSDSVVHTFAQLQSKTCSIASRYDSDSLVEEYLPGREFSVAILKKNGLHGYVTLPIELLAPPDARGQRILSAQVKSADSERFIGLDDQVLRSQVNELALDVFHALGARDYGRIDIRLDAHGVPHFLEANLIPSLIEGYGNFPKACLLNMGMDYESVILQIVELGMSRNLHIEKRTLAPRITGKSLTTLATLQGLAAAT